MKSYWIILACFVTTVSYAEDLGFRYSDGQCVNEMGEEGFNPNFIGQCGDLKAAYLPDLELSSKDLSGSQFEGVETSAIDFSESNLTGTNFRSVDITGASFNGCNLSNADFSNSRLDISNFVGARGEGPNLSQSSLVGADFSGAELDVPNFAMARLSRGIFKNVKIFEGTFKNAILFEADFNESDISFGDFSAANIRRSIFDRAIAQEVNFTGAEGQQASFKEANLEKSKFTEAKLKESNFRKANLTESNFLSASIEKADLSGTIMRKSIFKDVVAKGASFRRARIEYADLTGADLSDTNLRATIFAEISYEGTNFTNASYTRSTKFPFDKDVADRLGLILFVASKILILPDLMTEQVNNLRDAFLAEDLEVEVSEKLEHEFDGSTLNEEIGVIVDLNGSRGNFEYSMSDTGQMALVEFVQRGGVLINGEVNAYDIMNNRQRHIREITLFDRRSGVYSENPIAVVPEMKVHPILDGVDETFATRMAHNVGQIHRFDGNPCIVLAKQGTNDAVAVRDYGEGHILGFHAFLNRENGDVLSNRNYQKMMINAIMYWSP